MMTSNKIHIHSGIEEVYRAAADVLQWPRLLPHYRWVRFLDGQGSDPRLVVEMAASRNGFPCSWQSRMELHPEDHRIHYTHTRSTWTRGMEVWWNLCSVGGGRVEATITHEMPKANLITEWFRHAVVGRMFVENIADKTLKGLKQHLERGIS